MKLKAYYWEDEKTLVTGSAIDRMQDALGKKYLYKSPEKSKKREEREEEIFKSMGYVKNGGQFYSMWVARPF